MAPLSSCPFPHPIIYPSLGLHVTLDPRKPNQNLRGSLALPHGSGKALTCLVLTQNDAQRAAGVAAGGITTDVELTDVMNQLKKGEMEVRRRQRRGDVSIESPGARVRAHTCPLFDPSSPFVHKCVWHMLT